jgi:hypothetical protein
VSLADAAARRRALFAAVRREQQTRTVGLVARQQAAGLFSPKLAPTVARKEALVGDYYSREDYPDDDPAADNWSDGADAGFDWGGVVSSAFGFAGDLLGGQPSGPAGPAQVPLQTSGGILGGISTTTLVVIGVGVLAAILLLRR